MGSRFGSFVLHRRIQRQIKIKFELPRLLRSSNALESFSFMGPRCSSSSAVASTANGKSAGIDRRILEHLKKYYLEASKMQPPPKISPPEPFVVIKGSLDTDGPVLSRYYNKEEIKISVFRSANLEQDESDEENINQLFLLVVITKGDEGPALQFLCDLYPDAMGIQSVSLKDRKDLSDERLFREMILSKGYLGPNFQDLDRELQKAFRIYLEERGINYDLFGFLQAWLYVKEHRHLMQWLKTVGTFITKQTIPESS